MGADGERFLWLPGWSAGAGTWREAIDRAPEGAHRVCGFSSCARAGDLRDAARAALDAQPGPVTLVGWSLGAMVALELARDLPGRVRRLCLVGATDRFVAASGEPGGWPERVLTRMGARLAEDATGVLEAFDRRMFSPDERRAGHAERWIAARDGVPPLPSLRAGLDYLRGFSVDAAAIRVPARLLHGAEDEICPPAGAERLAGALPDARLTVWEGAGHAPFFTDPGRFARWLDGCVRT
ncbi:MAG: alpha/beta hydrolase [Actinomycetota bacterium]